LLGSEAFAEGLRPLLAEKRLVGEIPRGQRLASRPGLARLFSAAACRTKATRDAAIRRKIGGQVLTCRFERGRLR